MSTDKHTEGPIVVEEFVAGNGTIFMRVLGQDGEEVCAIRTRPGDEEDAARISLTWNSHDDLVEAVEGALHYLVNILEISETDKDIKKWVDAVTAAGGVGP